MSDGNGQMLPQDLEAERATLGSMMLDRQAVEAVISVIPRSRGEWFYNVAHRVLFDLLLDLYGTDQAIDLVVVNDALRSRGLYDSVGGEEYILDCVRSVSSWVNAAYYAGVVKQKGLLRDLWQVGQTAQTVAMDSDGDSDAAVSKVCDAIDLVQARALTVTSVVSFAEAVAVLENPGAGQSDRIRFPIDSINAALCGGLEPEELMVIGGSTSSGKTALVVGLAVGQARSSDGKATLFISREMSRDQITRRMFVAWRELSLPSIRAGAMDDEEYEAHRSGVAVGARDGAQIFITRGTADTTQIGALVRQYVRKHGVRLVIVDHLGFVVAPGKFGNQAQEIEATILALKNIAADTHTVMVVPAQLNRRANEDEGKRPHMGQLKGSSGIEQTSDVVGLLWPRQREAGPEVRICQTYLLLAKQRQANPVDVALGFNRDTLRYYGWNPMQDG